MKKTIRLNTNFRMAEVKSPGFYISYKDSRLKKWNLLINFIAFINAFLVPLHVGFHPPILESVGAYVMDGFIDFIFVIDIVLIFMTSFQTRRGEEITDKKMIR